GFSGFFKSLKKEGEIAFFCQMLVLDPMLEQKALEPEIQRQVASGHHTQLRYSEGQRWIGALEQVVTSKDSDYSGGTGWVIGGAKGIAFELLKQFPKSASWDLLLVGRSHEEEVIERLQILKNQELHCRYVAVDFTDPVKVEQLIQQESDAARLPQLLVQSAGIQLSKRLRDKTASEIMEELSAKIDTTRNCLQSQLISPQTSAILMSSVIARFGNHGQSVYALASGFAEALWQEHSWIQWPPWKKIGMTQSEMVSEVLEAAGVSLIEPGEAYRFWKNARDYKNTIVLGTGDSFLYQTPLLDFRVLGVQIDQVIPQRRRIGIYFQLNDFLKTQCRDHAIKNQAVVPLAWMAQWFLSWGQRLSAGEVCLKKLAVYRFLNASENSGLHCEVSEEALESSSFKWVLKDAQGVIAEACVEKSQASSELLLPQRNPWEGGYLAGDLYTRNRLFHGPRFQFISELRIQKATGSAKAEMHLPRWELFQIVDAALQTLGAYLLEVEDQRGIPVGVGRLSYQAKEPVQGALSCELIRVEKVEGGAEGKLQVFNQNQELICELEGAKFRVIDS
ncbi:SDR family NAD(P)-dependent oxidoreductase, partial [bacterium]|nr:SDR family NAD(P)-dependent oxidoreductase [bacterium]